MSETRTFKKYDTFAKTTYFVRLAQDARVFENNSTTPDGKPRGDDVVLTFCDNSRFENTEDIWVDARVIAFQRDRARGFRKGDIVQIDGKFRLKRNDDGSIRGKIYDAIISSFVSTKDREAEGAADPLNGLKDSLEF